MFSSRLFRQHQVKSRLDFLLALDADKAAFLCRSIADLTGIFACLAVEVGFSDEQSLVYAVDGSQKAGMHIIDIAVEPADYGLESEEARRRRLRSRISALYRDIKDVSASSSKPTLTGNVVLAFSRLSE